MDDVMLTSAFTGLQTNMLRPSIEAAGLDPKNLDEAIDLGRARSQFGGAAAPGPRRWQDIWSAGHSVSGVSGIATVKDLVRQTQAEFAEGSSPAHSGPL
jgi:nitronate monooxygenase